MYKPVLILIHADIGKEQSWPHRRECTKLNSRWEINTAPEMVITFFVTLISGFSILLVRWNLYETHITNCLDITIKILLIITLHKHSHQVNTMCYCSPALETLYFCLGIYISVPILSFFNYLQPPRTLSKCSLLFGLYSWKKNAIVKMESSPKNQSSYLHWGSDLYFNSANSWTHWIICQHHGLPTQSKPFG